MPKQISGPIRELFIAISVRIIQAILLLWSNENEKKN